MIWYQMDGVDRVFWLEQIEETGLKKSKSQGIPTSTSNVYYTP